jgi:hypothetical protein
VPIKPSLTYAFTLAEFGPQAIEFLFGTAALNDASTSFTPLATIGSLTGWLRCEFYSHADQKLVTTETWVALKPLEGIKADGQAWAEIRCEARVLLSGLNTGVIEAGSGGGGAGAGLAPGVVVRRQLLLPGRAGLPVPGHPGGVE